MATVGLNVLMVLGSAEEAEQIRSCLAGAFGEVGVTVAATLAQAREAVLPRPPDLVIADVCLPDGSGLDLLPGDPSCQAFPLLVRGRPGEDERAASGAAHAVWDYVARSPADPARWSCIVRRILREWRAVVENRQLRQALQESRDRLEALGRERGAVEQYIDLAGVVLLALDHSANVVFINRKGCEVLGCEPGEVLGKNWLDHFVPQRVRAEVTGVFRRLMSGKLAAAEHVENVVLCRGGKERLIAWHNAVVRDQSGRITGTVSSGSDITELRRGEELLKLSEKRLRRAQKIGHLGSWDWDILGEELAWSDELYRIWGVPKDFPLTYDGIVARIHPRDRAKNAAKVKQILESASRVGYDFRIVRPDGSVRYLHQDVEVSRDASGRAVRAWGVMQDITERKRVERQLRLANARLEEALARARGLALRAQAASRAKSEFLANMSHEIRTPMTAILGFADLLLAPNLPAEGQRELLAGISRNGKALLELIDDILDLSRIEADKVTLCKGDCRLREVVEDTLSVVRARAQKKGILLRAEYVPPLPETIHTDVARLRQILLNLVVNAVKFSHSGTVSVTVRSSRPAEGSRRVQFAVADNGIGIPADKLAGLFEPFTQVDGSSTRRYGGSGLGLAISKRLALALGGDIEVESEVGKGSTFTLTIDAGSSEEAGRCGASGPAAAGQDEAAAGTPLAPLRGRILLAEDVPDICNVFRYMLAPMKLELDTAEDGCVACEMAEKSQAEGKPYDLILMDIQMPNRDGYEATRWLRQHGWRGPIVGLTAYAMVGDREKCLAAGCDDYLPKPVTMSRLSEVLARYLPPADAGGSRGRNGPETAGPAAGLAECGVLSPRQANALVEAFRAELAQRAAQLEMAFQQGDSARLSELTHQLKGAAGIYGLDAISQMASAVGDRLRAGECIRSLQACLSGLVLACRQAACAAPPPSAESRPLC